MLCNDGGGRQNRHFLNTTILDKLEKDQEYFH
jgi:hypothetical protein